MRTCDLITRLRTYRAEIEKLQQGHPGRYSAPGLMLLFPRWYRYLNNQSSPLTDEIPWITFAAISFLRRTLTKDMIVYEFGSGGSSLFFAKTVRRVHSVEHDEEWFSRVSEAIRKRGYANWSGRVLPPAYAPAAGQQSPSDPASYRSGNLLYQGFSFERYVRSIDGFADGYFDVVLIDGRARPSCFKHAVRKVKVGGYLVWDNSDRPYYLQNLRPSPDEWSRTDLPGPSPYSDFFTQTSVFRKRKELGDARKIVIGSAGIAQPGWLATDKDTLDIVDRNSFLLHWKPDSIEALVAEHVWEHLSEDEAARADANCYEFLGPGGRLRIAVPDGLHPDPSYLEQVRPGGIGVGADDHRVLYDYRSLKAQLEKQGFQVHLLEYWDEHRQFHFENWSSEHGHIARSRRYDSRNQNGSLAYTSLIVDAIKPAGPGVEQSRLD
jgi:predicted SAM-dependent methyltransferase